MAICLIVYNPDSLDKLCVNWRRFNYFGERARASKIEQTRGWQEARRAQEAKGKQRVCRKNSVGELERAQFWPD